MKRLTPCCTALTLVTAGGLMLHSATAQVGPDEEEYGTLRPHGSIPVREMRHVAQIVHDFMNGVKLNKAELAFKNIQPQFQQQPEQYSRAVAMVQQILQRAGTLTHYVFLGSETLPYVERFVIVKFMSYHARGPVGWRVQFYRVNNQWRVLKLRISLSSFEAFFNEDELTYDLRTAQLNSLKQKK